MARRLARWAAGIALVAAPSLLHAQDAFVGSWTGELQIGGGQTLALTFNIAAGEGGTLTTTLDVPAQGAMGIPTESTTVVGDTLTITIPGLPGGARYVGVLGEDERIVGTFSQGPANLPLTLGRGESGPGPERPQHPEPPFPYDVEEVTYPNAQAGIELAGTFTTPRGDGPFPAVLLITGSGPQDRDETVAGHRIFAVLADYLTRQGIAVLRVDDRGVGGSTGDFEAATSRDFASDARAGVAWLSSRPDVDDGAIGLVGHSEGGLIAPMVAATDEEVDFIVLLAGPGVPGAEIIPEQSALIAAAAGAAPANVQEIRRFSEQAIAVVMRVPEPSRRDSLAAFYHRSWDSLTPPQRIALGMPADTSRLESALMQQATRLSSPWMVYFLAHDPAADLRRVHVPALAMWGSLDLQVPPAQSRPPMEAALREAGNTDVTFLEMERLNHLFQTATTGSPGEYATITETFAPTALEAVAKWILELGAR